MTGIIGVLIAYIDEVIVDGFVTTEYLNVIRYDSAKSPSA